MVFTSLPHEPEVCIVNLFSQNAEHLNRMSNISFYLSRTLKGASSLLYNNFSKISLLPIEHWDFFRKKAGVHVMNVITMNCDVCSKFVSSRISCLQMKYKFCAPSILILFTLYPNFDVKPSIFASRWCFHQEWIKFACIDDKLITQEIKLDIKLQLKTN